MKVFKTFLTRELKNLSTSSEKRTFDLASNFPNLVPSLEKVYDSFCFIKKMWITSSYVLFYSLVYLEGTISKTRLIKILRTYMPMRAKREVHRLSEYPIEGAVWGPPPPPHKIIFCSSSSSLLPASTDNCRNIDLYPFPNCCSQF